jgi:Fe-S-cluster containining protein
MRFVATAPEHDRIVAGGAADHFYKIEVTGGTFYMNDYRGGTCGYLKQNGTCRIQNTKPDVCRIYPIVALPDGSAEKHIACPIKKPLSAEFVDSVRDLVAAREQNVKPFYFDIVDAYDFRNIPWRLDAMGGRVTPPPTLK